MEEDKINKEDLFFVKDLKDGDFLENTTKTKYRVELIDDYVYLSEVDSKGELIPDIKRKKIKIDVVNGLIKTKHLSRTFTGKRISHGDLEHELEFNKLNPI